MCLLTDVSDIVRAFRNNYPLSHCLLFMSVLFLVSCGQTDTNSTRLETPAVTPEATEVVLNFYNWDTYIDPQILADFEKQYGITINYQIFENDDQLVTDLRGGSVAYDLIVPSDINVAILRREKLLQPLDKANIPNLENIDPAFLNPPFDPGNRYCVPYQWGTVGVGYNREALGRSVETWADVFDPAVADQIALLDDYRTTLGIVLIHLGYSPNSTNPVEVAEARDFLKEHGDHIVAYAPDDGQDMLAVGDVLVTMEYSGDVFQVMEENAELEYVIPADGSLIWVDNICIPVNAQHKELAEAFINYLLEPEVGAALSNYVEYGTPNAAAFPLVDEESRNNPAIYPSDSVRDRLFFSIDIGPEADNLHRQAWDEVIAAHNP